MRQLKSLKSNVGKDDGRKRHGPVNADWTNWERSVSRLGVHWLIGDLKAEMGLPWALQCY